MKKNGFTLIELLAVIVILAIIALIATPIILGIINDAREESNERSVELYASAVRNGIAAYQLREGKEVTAGTYNETNKLPFEVEYDGQVDCTSVTISETGKVTLEGCTVNGGTKEYSYGIEEETPDSGSTQPTRYYFYEAEFTGKVGETAAPANPSTEPPEGQNHYLGYNVTDGIISTIYACFTRNETVYCLKPNDFATSTDIIKDAFKGVLDGSCSFSDSSSHCYVSREGFTAYAHSSGKVEAYDSFPYCSVYSDGSFGCDQY